MRFPMNGEIEWVSHVSNESPHGEDLKGGSFSQEGEEEVLGPGPSPSVKVKVTRSNPDRLPQVTRRVKRIRHPGEGVSAGPESRTPYYSWIHDFILAISLISNSNRLTTDSLSLYDDRSHNCL